MTIGSLFSGIGGLELGLEWAGLGPVKWQVEQDDYANKVLAKHWPDVRRYTDVREVGRHNLERVDLICGGFPCQDVSVAGKQAGLKEGTRTGLWFEYARIIGELRPRYALVENVPGLVGTGGLNRVLADIAEIGYDAEWTHLSASDVGAPHRRQRIFILAYPNSDTRNGQLGLGSHGRENEAEQAGVGGKAVADTNGGLCVQQADEIRTGRNTANDGGGDVAHAERGGRDKGRTATRREEGIIADRLRSGGRKESMAHSDRTRQLQPQRMQQDKRRRPFDSGQQAGHWTTEPDVGRVANGVPSRVDRLKCLGNAVVPQCSEQIGRMILEWHLAQQQGQGS